MGVKTKSVMPWFVAVSLCGIIYLAAFKVGGPFPTDQPWTFYVPLVVMVCSAIVIVRCYVKIYAIFDRMDARAKEYDRNSGT
jgi:hypothetical protein